MSMRFVLQTARGPLVCLAATNYYPYREGGAVNPKFDANCGYILSLKDPNSRDFGAAVTHFSRVLYRMIRDMPFKGPAVVMLVPGSKAGKVSEGLIQIMSRICTHDDRLTLKADCLVRTKDIDKLATGGNRSTSVHRDSITFQPPTENATFVLLVDDVTTTGKSLVACCDIIRDRSPNMAVYGLALGKTTHE